MKKEISIKRNGNAIGTVGWLCKNLGHLKVGTTKNGKHRGIWAKDKEEKTLFPIAIEGYWEDALENTDEFVNNGPQREMGLFLGFNATPACWRVIEQIIEIARGLLYSEPIEKAIKVKVICEEEKKMKRRE